MQYTISDISKKYNIKISTLHYYEKEELLPKIKRSLNGNRIYDDSDVEWIELITCMRKAGMHVKEIKHYVQLCKQGKKTVHERYEIIISRKKEIELQMHNLQESYKKICEKEKCYLEQMNNDADAINPFTKNI